MSFVQPKKAKISKSFKTLPPDNFDVLFLERWCTWGGVCSGLGRQVLINQEHSLQTPYKVRSSLSSRTIYLIPVCMKIEIPYI